MLTARRRRHSGGACAGGTGGTPAWGRAGQPCRRRAVAPASRSTPRCRDLSRPYVQRNGAQTLPGLGLVQWAYAQAGTRRNHLSADQRGDPRCHAHRSGWAIWSSRTLGTCSWRRQQIWPSRRCRLRVSLGNNVQIRRPRVAATQSDGQDERLKPRLSKPGLR